MSDLQILITEMKEKPNKIENPTRMVMVHTMSASVHLTQKPNPKVMPRDCTVPTAKTDFAFL